MTEMEKKRNRVLAPQVIKALTLRNMTAQFAETREEALAMALEQIPAKSSVGWGGCSSAQEIGLMDALRQGDYQLMDRESITDPAEKNRLAHEILNHCDYFLTSVNGMSEDGVLVNIDGNANRVAAIAFGPDHVLAIVGMNKVVHSEEDAYRRAKFLAAPVNAQRFGLDTPCAKLGKCALCKHEQCICCQILVTRFSRVKGRIHLILVNEDLGF